MTLEQEIIELVRFSATKSVGDVSFSSSWISVRTRDLISIKQISDMTEDIGQLFISEIITVPGFWP